MESLFKTFTARYIPTEAQIARAEAALKTTFPPSYKTFCLTYGFGLVGGLYMIYVPRENPGDEKSLTYRARVLRERLENSKAFWREEDMKVGVDVWEEVADPGIVDRAVFIGQIFNGHEIFWDVKGGAEYGVYVEGGSTVRFGGNTLDEFIRRCQTDEIKMIFGPGYEPLASSFEGRD